MTTTLVENELLTEVQLPMLPNNSRFGFEEFSRRAGDYALTMALVVWEDEEGRFQMLASALEELKIVKAYY